MVDQSSELCTSGIFLILASHDNVKLECTEIEYHSSLGLNKRYHQPLRNTFHKLMHLPKNVEKDLFLAYAVKSMNDTLGPEGIVPCALVIGEFPRAYTKIEQLPERPSLAERAQIANTARKEMLKIMSELRVKRALKHKVSESANAIFQPGDDDVLVRREKNVNNRVGEWIGPFSVERVEADKKILFIRDDKKNKENPFNFAQVKKYYHSDTLSRLYMTELRTDRSRLAKEYQNEGYSSSFLTEIVTKQDPRLKSAEM